MYSLFSTTQFQISGYILQVQDGSNPTLSNRGVSTITIPIYLSQT